MPRAFISVADKEGLVDPLGIGLVRLGYELVSTGGTAGILSGADLPVINVEQVTNFPEMMGGRVKSMHPMVHGPILADRNNPEHMSAAATHGMKMIDIVVCNFYPLKQVIADPEHTFADVIENTDIGGPAMVNAAIKNHAHVLILTQPVQYGKILKMLRDGTIDETERVRLAYFAYQMLADYMQAGRDRYGVRLHELTTTTQVV